MSETLESYCEYYKRPCTVSDGLCSECGERLIEPASGATEESPKTKGMTNGKQRVEEILQKYSNAVVDEAVEKCVGGGIVVFAERAKAKRLEALDSIEEVFKDCLGEREKTRPEIMSEQMGISVRGYDPEITPRNNLRVEVLGRWESE